MKLNKLTAALFCCSIHPAFAGTMGIACDNSNVETPCASTAWSFAGNALYLEPSFPAFAWTNQRIGTDSLGNNVQVYGTEPEYNWGFFLEGAYHFNQDKDLLLNIYYYDDTTQGTDKLALGGTGKRAITSSWVAANFELGQALHIGEANDIRLHGGVQYARIYSKSNFSQVINVGNPIAGLPPVGPILGIVDDVFNGFGPRIGADLGYKLSNLWSRVDGFHVYTNGAIALLAGKNTYTASILGATPIASGNAYRTVNTVIPEIDLKLGVDYVYTIAQGNLTFDAGWLWVDYISAASYWTGGSGNGDATFQGLYFGLKWKGQLV
ncbi:MAG: Lpg1974 family pore-forming outer membrane protein [Legionellaceae bacterium]|nr:Lpg1974 family pore-forming outer membrane protein [Legionellaceae bacterium]